jgi:hypothetical protein
MKVQYLHSIIVRKNIKEIKKIIYDNLFLISMGIDIEFRLCYPSSSIYYSGDYIIRHKKLFSFDGNDLFVPIHNSKINSHLYRY